MRPTRHCAFMLFCAMMVATALAADPKDSLTLTDFAAPEAGAKWRAINDSVMGGRSRGGPRVESSVLVFSGEISLANRGGFSSTRSSGETRDLSEYAGLELRIKGDGRPYYVTMNTGARSWWMEVYYWTKIQPEVGAWSVVRVPFSSFVPTVRGRELRGHALDTSDIRSIGLMLYDKQAGPFRVELGEIRAYRAGSPLPPAQDIVATATAAGQFGTLLAAAKAAGLVEALRGRGPFTVFAPNDAAFAKLPAGTVESLLEPAQRGLLAQILKLHVIPGAVGLDAALAGGPAATLEGSSLVFRRDGDAAYVGASKIITPDLACSNGVIHVIDGVLLPVPPATPSAETPMPTARQLIELAIERGVPVFNAGQQAACQAIYEVALTSVLCLEGSTLTPTLRATLSEELKRSRGESPTEAAWRLRRALEVAHSALPTTTREVR